MFPIVAVLGVVPLTIADALGLEHPWLRPLALTLLGLTAAANGASLDPARARADRAQLRR